MVDLTQQLANIQAQLNNMNTTYTPTVTQTDPRQYCPHRLPCGLCEKTNSFCGMDVKEETKSEL